LRVTCQTTQAQRNGRHGQVLRWQDSKYAVQLDSGRTLHLLPQFVRAELPGEVPLGRHGSAWQLPPLYTLFDLPTEHSPLGQAAQAAYVGPSEGIVSLTSGDEEGFLAQALESDGEELRGGEVTPCGSLASPAAAGVAVASPAGAGPLRGHAHPGAQGAMRPFGKPQACGHKAHGGARAPSPSSADSSDAELDDAVLASAIATINAEWADSRQEDRG